MEVKILKADSTLKLENEINKWLKANIFNQKIEYIQYSSHSYGVNNALHEYSAIIAYSNRFIEINEYDNYTYNY